MPAPVRSRRIVSFALAVLLCASSLLAQAPDAARALQLRHRVPARPAVTGTDGSQTGTANFQGNFTTITAPGGSALVLGRKANCSLSLATGTYVLNSTLAYNETELDANYEQTLHNAAGLTTTPDVFASGCARQPPLGIGSKQGVYMGTTTTGIKVFAGIGLVAPSFVEGIYLLTGNTTFNTTSFAFNSVGNLATGDLNKDGNGDLIVTDNAIASAAHVTVFLGNADGSVQNGVAYPIAGNYSIAADIDDVNGDGNPDIIAVSGDQQISVLLGKGDGTFEAAQSFAAPTLPGYANSAATPIVNLISADLRGTGKKDIIASNGLVLLNSGSGTFTATTNPAFPFITALTSFSPTLSSGDLNNDGKVDLVVNDGIITSLWLGKGDGTFTQGARYGSINQTGFTDVTDLDGDGNADIFVGLGDGGYLGGDEGSPNLAYAMMGNGDGTFQAAPATNAGAYNGSNLGDVNNDGIADMVANTLTSGFVVQLGNGKGGFTNKSTFSAPPSFSLGGNTYSPGANAGSSIYAVGDINGDGNADVVFAINDLTEGNIDSSTPIYFVALSNGDGTFQTPVPYLFPQIATGSNYDISSTVGSIQIADLQHNGRPDLIFVYNEIEGGPGTIATPYNQGFAVLTGNGNGTFSATPILTSTYAGASAPSTGLADIITNIVDLNNDNIPDLIVNVPAFSIATSATTSLQTFIGNGDGTFKAPSTITVTGNPTVSIEVADFNKDGKPDLAFLAETSASQAELAIALGKGDGTFDTPTVSNLTGGDAILSGSLAAADFDGDGKIDLALLNNEEFSGIFYGNGDGTFSNVNTGNFIVPKDLINIVANAGPGSAVAVDLNKDGKPDILDSNVILLNHYGSTTTPVAATPDITPSGGVFSSAQSVTITDSTSGATIYYTTDGSTPGTGSTKYTAAINVNISETIQAIAVASGYTNSAVASAVFTISQPTAATPTFTPSGGIFTTTQSVTINDTTSGASIYYTTDGSMPTTSSTKYTAAISVGSTTTINAIATASGYNNSSVASATFTIHLQSAATPSFSPTAGVYTSAQSVTLKDSTSGANIYYTTDGSVPSSNSTQYSSAITVGSTETIKAVAYATGFTNSAVASATYTINLPPDFSIAVSPASVTATSTTPGTATVTITPLNGFNAQVSFACSGLPAGTSCSFNPPNVNGMTGGATTTTLTIAYSPTRAELHSPFSPLLPGGALAFAAICFGFRGRRKFSLLLLAFTASVLLISCGSNQKKSVTSTVTINATSGSLEHNATVSVTVP